MFLSFLYVFYILLAVAVALAHLFAHRSSRGTALAWLLLVILVPAIGALMYLLIGERRLGKTWMQRAINLQPQVVRWARASRRPMSWHRAA
jgi:cardiolipin synthase